VLRAYVPGLANRVVPDGQARVAAEELARQIAAFPQACVRSDRLSAYECDGRPEKEALAIEFQHGLRTLQSPEVGPRRGELPALWHPAAADLGGGPCVRVAARTGAQGGGPLRRRRRPQRQVLRDLAATFWLFSSTLGKCCTSHPAPFVQRLEFPG